MRERSGHLERVRRLHRPEQGKVLNILAGHHAIVEGMVLDNENQAVKAIRDHLSQTFARVEAPPQELPHYFV